MHGLSDEFLADKPLFARDRRRAARVPDGAEIIIHNAASTSGSSKQELRRIGRPALTGHVRGSPTAC